jgi:hypothetical protein
MPLPSSANEDVLSEVKKEFDQASGEAVQIGCERA